MTKFFLHKLILLWASVEYDAIYKEVDKLIKQYNPCGLKDGTCFKFRKKEDPSHHDNFCCNGCEHLGPNGCTVKALACKLSFCWYSEKNKEFNKKLEALKIRAGALPMYQMTFRKSKKQMFDKWKELTNGDTADHLRGNF
jgi:hypothetical protein